jgi:ribosome-associated heat shock protein Hsp15
MDETSAVRVDRWLWAARFYKTRSMANDACRGGKIDVNGQAAKAHRLVRPGDLLEISYYEHRAKVKVMGLSERRGPASEARLLYEDLTPPPPPKERRFLLAQPPTRPRGWGRPTKRHRREIEKLRGRS